MSAILQGARAGKQPLSVETLASIKDFGEQNAEFFSDIWNALWGYLTDAQILKIYKRGQAEPDKPCPDWNDFWSGFLKSDYW